MSVQTAVLGRKGVLGHTLASSCMCNHARRSVSPTALCLLTASHHSVLDQELKRPTAVATEPEGAEFEIRMDVKADAQVEERGREFEPWI